MQNPQADEEADKKCSHRNEETGKRCGAMHIKESPFCNVHTHGIEALIKSRSEGQKRRRDLKESLENGFQGLQTLEEIGVFYEKVCYGLLDGTLKKEKAIPLIQALRQMAALAKDRQKTTGTTGSKQQIGVLNINLQNLDTAKLLATFANAQQLDEFLLAGETISVKLIEDLQRQGSITVEAKEVPPEEDLFAEIETPSKRHPWKGAYQPVPGKGIAELWFTCQKCGAVAPNVNEEDCPKWLT